jgi:adenylate cyclase
MKPLYSRAMNEAFFTDLSTWLTQVGLAGTPETDIVSGCCDRCVAAGLPLGRTQVFIDTLHPVHEGRLFRWGFGRGEPSLLDYGRTSPDALAASGSDPLDTEAAERWRRSPFYRMLQTGESVFRRRLSVANDQEFSPLPDLLAAGMTDYVAIITRFGAEGVIGEMDGVYSSWATRAPGGFTDRHITTLERIAPSLALAIKSVSLARMTGTLMETYLGRDAGQRVLSGRIVRGIAERIDAVIWFSDLHGFTRITDAAPDQVIPLLNDYSDAIVSAIHAYGGDIVKLIGDGTLAIFTAEDRMHARVRCGIVCRDRRAAKRRRVKKATDFGWQARNRHVSRLARRRSLLWQHRKPGAARFYRGWSGRKRGKSYCSDVSFGRSTGSNIVGVRRRRGHQKSARFCGTIRVARRDAATGAVYA